LSVKNQQAMQAPGAILTTNISPTANHSVAAIHADSISDDASSLSNNENDNARSMRLLHQYFRSLAQTGTIWSIVDEKELVNTMLRHRPS